MSSNNPAPSMRPLGFEKLESLGFGSLFITYRNIANNCPLALWYGNPDYSPPHPLGLWYPLFPRRSSEEDINRSMIGYFDEDTIMNFTFEKRNYNRHECIVFRKTREDYGGLSNMAGGYPLLVNDVRILTSEALYQACRFPHLPEVQRLIIEQKSPMAAKMKSKSHRKNSREDWDKVRVTVMRWCLHVKLAQNRNTFGALLRSTVKVSFGSSSTSPFTTTVMVCVVTPGAKFRVLSGSEV